MQANIELPSRNALGHAVAKVLRTAILDGSLKPGQTLHENALAKQLSVSRSPIREALIQLERESLVVSRPNKPAAVRLPSPDEIRQVYTIRSALEGIAARWAAERSTPTLVSLLQKIATRLNDAAVSAEPVKNVEVVGLDLDFHGEIAVAAGSDELQRQLQSLRNQIMQVMSAGLASLTSRRTGEIHAEHMALIAAIAAKDGDRAESLASAHVRAARDRLVYLSAGA